MTERDTILVLCRHFGGYGGEENHFMCVVDAVKPYRTRVFARKSLEHHGFLPEPRENLSVSRYNLLRFLSYLARNWNRIALFLTSSADPYKGESVVFRALSRAPFPRLLLPAGNDVSRIVDHFDRVVWEADNADQYGLGGHPKNLVLSPPADHPMNRPADFPAFRPVAPYYLTVFNNYNAELKGLDLLQAAARGSRYPILWCTTYSPPAEALEGNLRMVSASRNLLSMLMAGCRAYLCVSSSEGFGWSNFEAMMHGRPIVSRPIGVLGHHADRIYPYADGPDLVRILNTTDFPDSVTYDLERFSPQAYLAELQRIMGESTGSG